MSTPPLSQALTWLLLAIGCAGATALLLIPAIRWLRLRALAHPNARSGHTTPTPQGAGLVAIPVFLTAAAIGFASDALDGLGGGAHLLAVAGAAMLLLGVGFVDDTRPLPVIPRFLAQAIAVLLVLATLPPAIRVAPFLPILVERTCLFLALAWFVNLTNFMDGMDGITAAETAAITFGLVVLSALGHAPAGLGWVGAAMLGAMLGFALFNAPPARVFLGDAGSLPLGLLLGTMLIHLAAAGAWAAALILPLYYLLDATLTLLSRLLRRERFWEAHRQHYYQRALRAGRSVPGVLAFVAALNATLVLLAVAAGTVDGALVATLLVVVAAALALLTMFRMAGGRLAE